ncbi:hypothetical protein BD309DRAFT_946440 [Dichomitus squalens]|nr:hypothetical protein BD309DRAFT_946440 [Dichomitus squalens]
MSSEAFLYFDDTSSVFSYSGNWFDNTDLEGFLAHGVFNDTISSTATQGSTVKVDFIASQIVVIGATIAPPNAPSGSGPISSYVLDNSQNSAFLFEASATNATGVTFFNSGPLSAGKHSLEITVLQVTDGIPFLLDAVAVGQPQATPSTAVWVTTVFATGTSAPTSVLDHSTATSSTVASSASSSKSLPIGAIVGGVVGGVALLVGAALAFYFLYWRKRHSRDYEYRGFSGDPFDTEKDHLAGPPPPPTASEGRFSARYSQFEPFLAPTSPTPYTDAPSVTPHTSIYGASALGAAGAAAAAAAGVVGATGAAAAAHTYPPAQGSVLSSSTSGVGRTLSVVNDAGDVGLGLGAAALTPAERKAAEAAGEKGGAGADQPVQYHADSGVRFDSEGKAVEASGSGSGSGSGPHEPEPLDVPPEYTEI